MYLPIIRLKEFIHPFKVDIVHSECLDLGVAVKLENLFKVSIEKLIFQLNKCVNSFSKKLLLF